MVNVDLYSAIITKVSNALDTLVSGEKPGFQTLSEGLVVLLCAEVVRQRVPDAPYIRPVWSVSSARRRRRAPNRCRRPTEASADFAGRENEGERERGREGAVDRSRCVVMTMPRVSRIVVYAMSAAAAACRGVSRGTMAAECRGCRCRSTLLWGDAGGTRYRLKFSGVGHKRALAVIY